MDFTIIRLYLFRDYCNLVNLVTRLKKPYLNFRGLDFEFILKTQYFAEKKEISSKKKNRLDKIKNGIYTKKDENDKKTEYENSKIAPNPIFSVLRLMKN